MNGQQIVNVTLPNGALFPILFDFVSLENVYIQLTLTSINEGTIDTALIQNYLVANYDFTIFSPADITTVTSLVKSADPTVIVTQCQVSGYPLSWANSVYPSALNNIFVLTAMNIFITI